VSFWERRPLGTRKQPRPPVLPAWEAPPHPGPHARRPVLGPSPPLPSVTATGSQPNQVLVQQGRTLRLQPPRGEARLRVPAFGSKCYQPATCSPASDSTGSATYNPALSSRL
jgi:hypothetical protein